MQEDWRFVIMVCTEVSATPHGPCPIHMLYATNLDSDTKVTYSSWCCSHASHVVLAATGVTMDTDEEQPGQIVLGGVNCTGGEPDILSCRTSDNSSCERGRSVSLNCSTPGTANG